MVWDRDPILPSFIWLVKPVFFHMMMPQHHLLNALLLCPVICNAISLTFQISMSKWFCFSALYSLWQCHTVYYSLMTANIQEDQTPCLPHTLFLLFLLKPTPPRFPLQHFWTVFSSSLKNPTGIFMKIVLNL